MMESSPAEEMLKKGDFSGLAALCEQEELQSEGGVASPQVYGTLLAIYLLQNELDHAKLLWQRIPQDLKVSHSELGRLWEIGKRLWQREFPPVYQLAGDPTWPEYVAPMMASLIVKLRDRVSVLIGRAYKSIRVSDLCALLGQPEGEINKVAEEKGWEHDPVSNTYKPKPIQALEGVAPEDKEERLKKLTDIISFLEN